jgi:hypothetical protein
MRTLLVFLLLAGSAQAANSKSQKEIEFRLKAYREGFSYAFTQMHLAKPETERQAERLLAMHFNKYDLVRALRVQKGMVRMKKTGSLLTGTFLLVVIDSRYDIYWWTQNKNNTLVDTGDSEGRKLEEGSILRRW